MDISVRISCLIILTIEQISPTEGRFRGHHGAPLWHPQNGTREDFFRCRGLPCDEYYRMKEVMVLLEHQLQQEEGISNDLGDPINGCIVYTESQAVDIARQHLRHSNTHTRRIKRKFDNTGNNHELFWDTNICYVFDGTHDDDEQEHIRKAFDVWETDTCLSFYEVDADKSHQISSDYLLITKENFGCYSFVGRVGVEAQVINLSSPCLLKKGTAIHEIGHALGLWHEHQRIDRDDWITINYENIGYYISQFYAKDTISHGLPYDFSSVMQYPMYAGSSNGGQTITAKDPLYQYSMGQRIEASFLDRKIVNEAYCKESCVGSVKLVCSNGGYQNPQKCNRCVCPDGFSGRRCRSVSKPVNDECGGIVNLHGESDIYIQSPGYDSPGYYGNHVECTWHIQVSKETAVDLNFVGDFGIFREGGQVCAHWVEIKYGNDFEYPGPRFCGETTPVFNITAWQQKMVIIFKSNQDVPNAQMRRGFKINLRGKDINTRTTEKYTWSHWSECNGECKCGGCSFRTRHTLCNGDRCNGTFENSETQACTSICAQTDVRRIFPDSDEAFPCPRCCGIYEDNKVQGICQLSTTS